MKLSACLLLLGLAPQLFAAPVLEQQTLWTAGQDGYHTYRIPALLVTAKGSVLAFCEGRKTSSGDHGDVDLIMKRSTDGGRTWSPHRIVHEEGGEAKITIGNPCPVVDSKTGSIWLPFTRDNKAVFITSSTDDGQTWSAPRNLSATTMKPDWDWVATGPGIGIQLASGRLLIPSYHSETNKMYRSHAIFSDDHGATWQLGGIAADNTSEPQVIELDSHTLLMNARTIAGFGGHRTQVISRDRGTTWQPAEGLASLVENQCQGCIYRCFRSGSNGQFDWFFTHPITPGRVGVHAWISEDSGKSWPHAQQLWSGPSAYTVMTRLQGGLVGLLMECGEKQTYEQIVFLKFAPEWLKAGKAPELKPPPAK